MKLKYLLFIHYKLDAVVGLVVSFLRLNRILDYLLEGRIRPLIAIERRKQNTTEMKRSNYSSLECTYDRLEVRTYCYHGDRTSKMIIKPGAISLLYHSIYVTRFLFKG